MAADKQTDLPDAHFGSVTDKPVDWRKKPDPAADFDDDTEMLISPPDVVAMLGFDPKDLDKDTA